MKTSPSIQLTHEETKLFEAQEELFLRTWRNEIERLHMEFPDHSIMTIGHDKHARPIVLFIWIHQTEPGKAI